MKQCRFIMVTLVLFSTLTIAAQTNSNTYDSSLLTLNIDSFIRFNPYIYSDSTMFSMYDYDESEFVTSKNPEQKDSANLKLYKKLVLNGPLKNNFNKYIEVAHSLWQLNEIDKAEKMFLVIINSTQPFYTKTTYNWSGTKYSYGSFTSNFKNDAAFALAKIYIQKKNCRLALKYINDATTKYKIYYTCGTGTMWYNNEIKALKSRCYEELAMVDKGISYLLPYALDGGFCSLTRLLKKKYTTEQLVTMLNKAETTIRFKQNTDSSTTELTSYDDNDSAHVEIRTYLSATVTIDILGKILTIPSPELKDKEVATKEQFVAVFKNSTFYKNLTE
jgi:hypothetical protein